MPLLLSKLDSAHFETMTNYFNAVIRHGINKRINRLRFNDNNIFHLIPMNINIKGEEQLVQNILTKVYLGGNNNFICESGFACPNILSIQSLVSSLTNKHSTHFTSLYFGFSSESQWKCSYFQTTIYSQTKLFRRWIGIKMTFHSLRLQASAKRNE